MADAYQQQRLTPGDAQTVGEEIKRQLAQGMPVWLNISGTSMKPTLQHRRDAIRLVPIGAWPPKNHTILFIQRPDGSYCAHRVIRRMGDGVVLNGDAQLWVEGPIPRGMAVAQVDMLRRGHRLIPVTRRSYRAFVAVWVWLRPWRGVISRVLSLLRKGGA